MQESLKPLALQFELNTRLFLRAIGDIPPDLWEKRPEGRANHAAFLALHLLDARCFILRLLGNPMTHGFEEVGKDATHLEDISDYPPPQGIADSWKRVSEDLMASVEAVGPEQLSGPAPHEFPVTDGSVFGAIAFLAQHEAYHIGQLAMVRRAVGLSPSTYS
jgi:uncharacterized damage-inducible protein DinB